MTEVSAVEVIASASPRKPTNGETLITMVLDETSSMSSCLDQTISSVNEYFATQKNGDGIANVNLYTFSEQNGFGTTFRSMNMNAAMQAARDTGQDIRPVFENLPIAQVGEINKTNFKPNGMTNLYDAVGFTIKRLEAQLESQASVPNMLVVIVTDGGENASKEFTSETLTKLVKEKTEEGWTFVYLGANQDAWKVGQSFGLAKGQTMTYSTDHMESTMATLSAATGSYRSARAKGFVAEGTASRDFFGGEEN